MLANADERSNCSHLYANELWVSLFTFIAERKSQKGSETVATVPAGGGAGIRGANGVRHLSDN